MKKADNNGWGGFRLTNYMKKRKVRLEEEKIEDSSLFGQIAGTILMLIGFLRWMVSYNNISYLWMILFMFGIFLFIAGVLIPQCIAWLYDGMRFIGNKVGCIIFSVMLFAVYSIFIIPTGYFIRSRRNDYMYVLWDEEFKGKEISVFFPRKEYKKLEEIGIRGETFKLIQYLIINGKIIFLPVVIILLILGIILFFVSSSIFAPFIYTLF